jgi:hypothetical protein
MIFLLCEVRHASGTVAASVRRVGFRLQVHRIKRHWIGILSLPFIAKLNAKPWTRRTVWLSAIRHFCFSPIKF